MATKVRAARRLAAQGVVTALLSGRRPGPSPTSSPARRWGPSSPGARSGSPRARGGWRRRPAGRAPSSSTPGPGGPSPTRAGASSPAGYAGWRGSSGSAIPWTSRWKSGRPFARGLAGYAADEVRRIAGLKTSEIERALGYKYLDEVVHRNDLVVLESVRE